MSQETVDNLFIYNKLDTFLLLTWISRLRNPWLASPDPLPGMAAEVGTLCDVNAVPTVPAPGNRAFTLWGTYFHLRGQTLTLCANPNLLGPVATQAFTSIRWFDHN
jgi:hypothetical protein